MAPESSRFSLGVSGKKRGQTLFSAKLFFLLVEGRRESGRSEVESQVADVRVCVG